MPKSIKNKGFTLIEMLVTIGIFSLIIGTTIGLFASAIRIQRYNLTYQQILDQTSYVMEYMNRAIRMAQKDTEAECITAGNYELIGDDSIKFKTYKSSTECWRFYRNCSGGICQLMVEKAGSALPLTSPNLNVTSLKFNVAGDASGQQPKVTLFMEITGRGSGSQPKLKIQTTVSQRNLNL